MATLRALNILVAVSTLLMGGGGCTRVREAARVSRAAEAACVSLAAVDAEA
jgi:hypothetical protein